ncbi:phage-related tail protein [Novosphingobium nitrogenifigens DSM 19370]|uniref:Phage-related tail protein n=1 Tax=Novosphingobium nitrogenifigens DSM 19370 TaxID=983920 RepID=F1Z9A6_9SPHN|nr:tail protein X [Novosphingobium nitrogenifigens]EGD58399.1 phage-related tail protein [Novosphingobium nitrogenifigens DSM 19370]
MTDASTFITTTLEGDTLDLVCWRELGTTAGGVVEKAYTLNPGLADLGPTLPGGIDVVLPVIDTQTPQTIATVSLWS